MMRRFLLLLSVPAVLGPALGLGWAGAQTYKELLPVETRGAPPFEQGEKLVYEIFWKPLFFFPSLKAGEITLTISESTFNDEETYKIQAWAISDGALARVAGLEVNNYFESQIDRENFRSYRNLQRTREGKRERNLELIFDYRNNRTIVKETDPSVDPPRKIKDQIKPGIPAPVIDMLSVFYVARIHPIRTGENYSLFLNERGEFKKVRVLVEQTEEVETALGEFDTVKLKTTGGALKGGGDFRIWFGRDLPRIPIKFEADAKVGKVWGGLIQADTPRLNKRIIKVG